MKRNVIIAVVLLLVINSVVAQERSDANIFGHVVHNGEHIPFANIMIKGTTIGTSTDETGHFLLVNLPPGKYVVRAQALGYKAKEKEVEVFRGQTIEVDFELETDVFGLDEVVITGDRNIRHRRASTVVVSTLNPRTFEQSASVTVSDGLNFATGLRVENNCQNCGFNQIRMNGLEGPYTQILINNRPIFSGLMGVYGLELIPVNMIDRIEVVRGGGSALYGSNAIGGTINMILKDPIRNTFEFGVNSGLIGGDFKNMSSTAMDNTVKMNASIISSDSKTGFSVYGFSRNRDFFDATGDSFSELTSINNTTIGTRLFHRPNNLSKLTLDYFNINEDRRGGNEFDKPYHEADITEAVEHRINSASVNYDRYFRGLDIFSVYASAQHINRDSYYGDSKSLADYGNTKDLTINVGAVYNFIWDSQNLMIGVENTGNHLKDIKLGYPDYENSEIIDDQIVSVLHMPNTTVANQKMNIIGSFVQYEKAFNNLKINIGTRFDNYSIKSNDGNGDSKSGNVIVPRGNILYDISDRIQTRVSYAKGYRAPQIFDEDLHIETSTSRTVLHRNDPGLTQETSHSFSGSIDYNTKFSDIHINLIAEGFYTILNDAFVNEFGDPDEDGTVIYTRVNAEGGAIVRGINLEMNMVPAQNLNISAGFTLQQSFYEEEHEFGETRFFRTPNDYGFMTFDWTPKKNISLSTTGTYTGKMLIPYFGNRLPDPDEGELRVSERFFDMGVRASYAFKLNGASLQFFGGVRNVFNSYQSDFDLGADRDPGYIYGPSQPRTVYVGINFGNALL